METKYIREFLVLAETESYFETAERMFVSTSSLSRHIKSLEESLGMTLFDRTTRKVQLNRQGRIFLPFAKRMIEVEDECNDAFEENHQAIRIGSIPMMKAYRINEIIGRFRKENKGVVIDLHEADSTVLKKMLEDNEVEFAFLRNRDISADEFETIPIAQDHLVAVVPRSHPFAAGPSITIDQLKEESLLLISKNSYMYRLCMGLCESAGFKPHVVFTSQRAENLMDLVQQGIGIALLTQKPIAPILPETLCAIPMEPQVTSVVFLACARKQEFSPVSRKFLTLCRSISTQVEEEKNMVSAK